MSTIEEVRAAEKRVQQVLDALRKAGALDQNHVSDELKKATDEYARLVRELKGSVTPLSSIFNEQFSALDFQNSACLLTFLMSWF